MTSLQQAYVPGWQHCYGCGPQNAYGLQLASYWLNQEAVATFQPRPEHCAAPGYLFGGIIAALIDCHSIATAAVTASRRGSPLGR
jgi:hypothetical protein